MLHMNDPHEYEVAHTLLEEGTEYYGLDFDCNCIKGIRLHLDGHSDHLSRRTHHRGYCYRTWKIATVDFFQFEKKDWRNGKTEQFVIVQERTYRNGIPSLKREYVLTCEQANNLYLDLKKRNFH